MEERKFSKAELEWAIREAFRDGREEGDDYSVDESILCIVGKLTIAPQPVPGAANYPSHYSE